MDEPQTRAEAREASVAAAIDAAVADAYVPTVTAELGTVEREGFLSLGVRRVLYLAGLAGAALAPVLAVTHPEYAAGIVAGSGVLTAAARGTALANPSR